MNENVELKYGENSKILCFCYINVCIYIIRLRRIYVRMLIIVIVWLLVKMLGFSCK